MNIDYAKIIEQANARKDALLHLNDLLQSMPQHLKALSEVRAYTGRLYAALVNLDPEAQALVGGPGVRALEKLSAAVGGAFENYLLLLDYPGGIQAGNGKTVLQNLVDLCPTKEQA